jgi:hypothetical protein
MSVALSQEVKRSGREADHTPLSSAEVKNGGAISLVPYIFMAYHGVMLVYLRTRITTFSLNIVPQVSSRLYSKSGGRSIPERFPSFADIHMQCMKQDVSRLVQNLEYLNVSEGYLVRETGCA